VSEGGDALKINKHRPDWFLVSLFINVFEENEKGMEKAKHVCEFSNTSGLLCHMPPPLSTKYIIALMELIQCRFLRREDFTRLYVSVI
jgi:hypothetical protein